MYCGFCGLISHGHHVHLGDSVRYHLRLEPAGIAIVAEQPRSAGTSWQPSDAVVATFAADDPLPLQSKPEQEA